MSHTRTTHGTHTHPARTTHAPCTHLTRTTHTRTTHASRTHLARTTHAPCTHPTACSLHSFDNLSGKNNIQEPETPLGEPARFRARSKSQQKKLSPGIKAKMLKESAAADPNQANLGVVYAICVVGALILLGGDGILFNAGDSSAIGTDVIREAANPGNFAARPPTFGTSMGSANRAN